MSTITLSIVVFLICMDIGGAPFGVEAAVGAVGPLFALLSTLIFPFIVGVPYTHITAELSSIAPTLRSPFWGLFICSVKYFSGIVDLAISAVLCLKYLENASSYFTGRYPRALFLLLSTLSLSFLNYIGLLRRGRYTSACFFLLPLFLSLPMSLIAISRISIHRCFSTGQEGVPKNWNLLLITFLWKLKFWEFDREVLTGNVQEKSLLFKAHFISVTLTCFTLVVPIAAIAGALSVNQDEWKNGFFVIAAEMIGRRWLRVLIQIAAALSTVKEFEDGMTNCSYQLMGMVKKGYLPHFIGSQSKRFHTSWVAILVSTGLATILFADLKFLAAWLGFFRSFTVLLELTLFLCLRWEWPEQNGTFPARMRMPGLVVMCLVVSMPYVFTLALTRSLVFPIMACVTFAVIALLYLLMQQCKKKRWLRFTNSEEHANGEERSGAASDVPANSIHGGHHGHGDGNKTGDFSSERLHSDKSDGTIGFTESDSGALDLGTTLP
ncbi:probable polyamine transporter At3g13620 [Malania oleifera]|uniref:probable polyamine transporter At3g13620 n=1 Tax=Malania oleifera TaxID=397392 RepID=UPI0025ADDB87|nr:probable polyamine transporter At3g13620 [Malania oleifera]